MAIFQFSNFVARHYQFAKMLQILFAMVKTTINNPMGFSIVEKNNSTRGYPYNHPFSSIFHSFQPIKPPFSYGFPWYPASIQRYSWHLSQVDGEIRGALGVAAQLRQQQLAVHAEAAEVPGGSRWR